MLYSGRKPKSPTSPPGDVVILKQASVDDGIYYIDGGGFKSTGATITMDGSTSGLTTTTTRTAVRSPRRFRSR